MPELPLPEGVKRKGKAVLDLTREKLPRGTAETRKFFWPSWNTKRVDEIRETYKRYAAKAQEELEAKEQTHGNYYDVANAAKALEGYKYNPLRTSWLKKITKRTLIKKKKQKGLADVLKDAKKLAKMKPEALDSHIADVKFVADHFNAIKGNVKPGKLKEDIAENVSDYLAALNDLKAGTIQATDDRLAVDAISNALGDHREKIKEAFAEMTPIVQKKEAYEGVEYFSNSVPLHELNRIAKELNVKEMNHLETRIEELKAKKLKNSKLEPDEDAELEDSTKRFNKLLKAGEAEGYHFHGYSETKPGEPIKGTIVTQKFLDEETLKQMQKTDSLSNRAVAGTALMALVSAGGYAYHLLSNKLAVANQNLEASRATEQALRDNNDQLRTATDAYANEAAARTAENEQWRQAFEASQAQTSPAAVTAQDPFAAPVQAPTIQTAVTGQDPFTPPTIPPSIPATVTKAGILFTAPAVFGPAGIVLGVGAVASGALRKVATTYGETVGKIRKNMLKNHRKVLKRVDEAGPESAQAEAKEKITTQLWKKAGTKADVGFTNNTVITRFRPGELPELDSE